ncbi:universal stress protein [Kitasatospora nipponensis]|uniref:Universal stress protein n=1 Tax=Kitasatospora nipponensis TaxID=258049 RepID=A0ABN1W258_9ACTN
MEIDCVVAGVDGSPESLRAVDWAADEAFRREVGLRLVHACLWERYEAGTPDEEGPNSVRAVARTLLDAAARRARGRRPGIAVDTEVIPEETVAALLGLGRLAPLLVLGSRGHGGFAGLPLGSVSRRVAARATYPVVVVRGAEQVGARRHGRVLVGAVPHEAGPAVAFAAEEARLWHAELRVVSVGETDGGTADSSVLPAAGATTERAGELVAALPAPADTNGGVRGRARRRHAAAALLEAAADVDLVVVGARRPEGRAGWEPGPVDDALLRHAPCPVAVVPHP